MLAMPIPFQRQDKPRTVDVTITFVTLTGLHAHELAPKQSNDISVVASVSSDGACPTFIQSLPIVSYKKTCDVLRFHHKNESQSSIQFRQTFDQGTKYLLSKCGIDLSLSINGKLYPLGTADLVINGEDRETRNSLHVPIERLYPSKKSMFRLKKNGIPMFKPDGMTCKYGLAGDATMNVIVHVQEAADKMLSPATAGDRSSSLFSFNTQEFSSVKSAESPVAEKISKDNDDVISVDTLSFDDNKSFTVMREISGLTSYWYENLSLDEDPSSTTTFGSTNEIETMETILSTDSDSDWLSFVEEDSLPSQFGVEVVPYRPRVRFGAVEEYEFTVEMSNRILVTLPSKRGGTEDDDGKDGKCRSSGGGIWARGLKQCVGIYKSAHCVD
jgi:hypothetical protein